MKATVLYNKQKLSLNYYFLRKGDWNKHLMLLQQVSWAEGRKDSKEVCWPVPPLSWHPYWGTGASYQGNLLPKSRMDECKPIQFRLSLLQEWVLTASISSASQAIQQSSLSLLPWAMKHSQKWVSEQLDNWKMYSQQGCIEGVGLIGRFSSKSDNFGDTENCVDFQCSSPTEKKKQVASKWLKSTVEPSRILVLFLAAADKILVLKHFFFFFTCLSSKFAM